MTLIGMITELRRAGVRFVVIGGLAARAHGSSHITDDLDICYEPERDNVERLATTLAGWRAYLRGAEPGLPFAMDRDMIHRTPVMTLVTDLGAIDIMDRVQGVGEYAEVERQAVPAAIGGTEFLALDLPALLAAKRATRRPKDLDQIPELGALLELRRTGKRR